MEKEIPYPQPFFASCQTAVFLLLPFSPFWDKHIDG